MTNRPMHVLVADDEEGMVFVLRELVEKMGYRVTEAGDGVTALAALREHRFDLAILDVNMPKMSGLDVLREARKIHPTPLMLVVTAYGSPEIALEAMREGAYDYFTKPFELQEMRITIQRALEKRMLQNQVRDLENQVEAQPHFEDIIGVCDPMQKVFGMMRRVIDNEVPVLVTGESGTGKEVVVKAIHSAGARRDGPMVSINCAAIPENLLESELFGHEKGAFTGAVASHPGKFEQAQDGTLFLDEIGEMPLALQPKLLRALQEREVQRVGSTGPLAVNARIIAATNKDLAAEVAEKRFREDLYFRINVIAIELPPLRERLADIPLLVDSFLGEYNSRLGKSIEGLSPEAMDVFLTYSWPGNVRELENVVQRLLIMASSSTIEASDLPESLRSPGVGASGGGGADLGSVSLDAPMAAQTEGLVEVLERRLIEEALRVSASRQEAADRLGISRMGLHRRMSKYGISSQS